MQESSMQEGVRAELEALRNDIEAVRHRLAREHGITIEDKEALHQAIGEKISGALTPPLPPAGASTAPVSQTPKTGAHYLDLISDEDAERVNTLISEVGTRGIAKTIEKAKEEEPYIIDAFHDALVDKLYEDLKKHGIIK